ncbi:MAG: hypothetical protein LBH69_00135 [Methanomassiliicoccaceae archaeon]|nr:hypothetical protein [Methanomassiliicoccaceae archaeon]
MTDDKITFIAEGMIGLNNSAVELVRKGEYDGAEEMFETMENTAKLFGYNEGVGMARMSLASISMMRGRLLEALSRIEGSVCIYPECEGRKIACDMQSKIVLVALDMGIKRERAGKLNDALELFEAILPKLNEKRAAAISKEIAHIKAHLAKKGTDG